jgi:hypothetical protein
VQINEKYQLGKPGDSNNAMSAFDAADGSSTDT